MIMVVLFAFAFIHLMTFTSIHIFPELPLALSYSTFLSLHGCRVNIFHQRELLVTCVHQPRMPGQVRYVVCLVRDCTHLSAVPFQWPPLLLR